MMHQIIVLEKCSFRDVHVKEILNYNTTLTHQIPIWESCRLKIPNKKIGVGISK